ncbi:hypothetical protein [Massilia sp. S19_KUP03_FR1]|uniref:hypothetical protein n=1 Tax=Massilia sp. S19_KUP03_FR1 TaxID=3025503 RepID=UPI002FCDD155
MHRYVLGLSLSLLLTGLLTPLCAGAAAASPVVITFAEAPVYLWRDTGRLIAGRGTPLQANDLVDASERTIQLVAAGSTIALGPDSRLFVKSAAELVLLKGWLKVRGAPAQGVKLRTSLLQFDSSGATVTLHAAPGSAELFVESGEVPVTELVAGKAQRSTRLPREQFAVKSAALPLTLASHPPKAFLAAMPRALFDALVSVAASGPANTPRRERAATFDELAPLLAEHPALLQQVQRRFQGAPARGPRPRLSNALF